MVLLHNIYANSNLQMCEFTINKYMYIYGIQLEAEKTLSKKKQEKYYIYDMMYWSKYSNQTLYTFFVSNFG